MANLSFFNVFLTNDRVFDSHQSFFSGLKNGGGVETLK